MDVGPIVEATPADFDVRDDALGFPVSPRSARNRDEFQDLGFVNKATLNRHCVLLCIIAHVRTQLTTGARSKLRDRNGDPLQRMRLRRSDLCFSGQRNRQSRERLRGKQGEALVKMIC